MLNEDEAKDLKKLPVPAEIFPDDLVRLITNYQPVNVSSINEKLAHLEGQFKVLNEQLLTSREWQEKFETNLTKIQNETSKIQDETAKIANLLKEEIAERKQEVREIRETTRKADDKITEVDKKTAVVEERRFHNSRILWAIIAFIVSILTVIIGYEIRDMLGSRTQGAASPPPPITSTPSHP